MSVFVYIWKNPFVDYLNTQTFDAMFDAICHDLINKVVRSSKTTLQINVNEFVTVKGELIEFAMPITHTKIEMHLMKMSNIVNENVFFVIASNEQCLQSIVIKKLYDFKKIQIPCEFQLSAIHKKQKLMVELFLLEQKINKMCCDIERLIGDLSLTKNAASRLKNVMESRMKNVHQ